MISVSFLVWINMGQAALLLLFLVATATGQDASNETSKEFSSTAVMDSRENVEPVKLETEQTEAQDSLFNAAHSSKKRVLKSNEENEIIPLMETADSGFFEAIINAEKRYLENEKLLSLPSADDITKHSPDQSSLPSIESMGLDIHPHFEFRRRSSQQGVDFDDSKQDPLYSSKRDISGRQFIRDPTPTDARPLLQLTQGGYRRPYLGVTRPQRIGTRPEESERSSENGRDNAQEAEEKSSFSQPGSSDVEPVLRQSFFPPGVQGFSSGLYPPQQPAVQFPDFQNNLQSQFGGNEASGYHPFFFDNGAFQGAPVNSFPGYFAQQGRSQFAQPQPIITSYQQPQFSAPVSGFPGFGTNDAYGQDYAALFGGQPPVNPSPQTSVAPFPFFSNSPPQTILSNADVNLMANFRPSPPQFSSRFLRHPSSEEGPNPNPPATGKEGGDALQKEQQQEKRNNLREDEYTRDVNLSNQQQTNGGPIPFGSRLQTPPLDNVFIRYPITEAGYGTQEPLPSQNISTQSNETSSEEASNERRPRPFPPIQYPFPRGRDPYIEALNAFQQRQNKEDSKDSNRTYEFASEPFLRPAPASFSYPPLQAQVPPNNPFFGYPDRSQDIPGLSSFYPSGNDNQMLRSFTPTVGIQFQNSQNAVKDRGDSNQVPECAKKTNATVCFEDDTYPRREIMYSLNLNSYALDRLVSPFQGPEELKQKANADESEENFLCKADVKQGRLLRAVNALGVWKVVVNMDASFADGRFMQPVALEICRETSEPCSYTNARVTTRCFQKTNFQRLLTWNPERGIHMDSFKLPIACSCQVLNAPET